MEKKIQTKSNQKSGAGCCMGAVSGRVLLAEKDKMLRKMLSKALEKANYEIQICRDGIELLDHVSSFLFSLPGNHDKVDVIISDILLPGVTGLELLDGIQNVRGFPPMILIMESCMRNTIFNGKNIGAEAVFKKPFDVRDLVTRVDQICKGEQKVIEKPEYEWAERVAG